MLLLLTVKMVKCLKFLMEFLLIFQMNDILVKRNSESKEHKSKHGLYRSLVANMVIGVSEGFTKELELVGVGYRASNSGQKLDLALGFSHTYCFRNSSEVKVEDY